MIHEEQGGGGRRLTGREHSGMLGGFQQQGGMIRGKTQCAGAKIENFSPAGGGGRKERNRIHVGGNMSPDLKFEEAAGPSLSVSRKMKCLTARRDQQPMGVR